MTDPTMSESYDNYSTQPSWDDIKPRDEIAQAQVDFREKRAGIELDSLPRKPLSELAQGDIVLHEGVWVKIEEYTRENDWIRLQFVLPSVSPVNNPVWDRRIIASGHEEFYVAGKGKKMSAGRHTKREMHPSLVCRVPPRDEQE